MTKVVIAEYDAAENALRLVEPLEGVADHEKVQVKVIGTSAKESQPAWIELRGSLSKAAGEELSNIVNEMFPPWE
jgi:hypothetical protein